MFLGLNFLAKRRNSLFLNRFFTFRRICGPTDSRSVALDYIGGCQTLGFPVDEEAKKDAGL
jgi:hypothetical protein